MFLSLPSPQVGIRNSSFSFFEDIAHQLPKLLLAKRLRSTINKMQLIPIDCLQLSEYEYMMMLLSFVGHGYVWESYPPATFIPASLAIPWTSIAQQLERPPVLSYASYVLNNWGLFDSKKPIELSNIYAQQNFLGGFDESGFILIHVEIEAYAARAVTAIKSALYDPNKLNLYLADIEFYLRKMYETLCKMPDYCDPYIYYNRVRPYLHGWDKLPNGLIYEGTSTASTPQKFYGETGAQSSIIPMLDKFFGVAHKNDAFNKYLLDMKKYMPKSHRNFIDGIDSIHPKVFGNLSLSITYNACVEWLSLFRTKHLEYAAVYINQQHQQNNYNSIDIGTGGTPFLGYLKKHRDETIDSLIK